MSSLIENIKELLIFYVKTNYENYLEQNKIKKIKDEDVASIVKSIYESRKQHSKDFVKTSLKQILKSGEYPGDSQIDLLLRDIYDDEILLLKKLENQIIEYQNSKV